MSDKLIVTVDAQLEGRDVTMTQKDHELAVFLLRNIGRLLRRAYILEAVWGQSAERNTRTIDTHVSRIRGKLEFMPKNGWRLSAVYQHGYRLERVSAAAAQQGKARTGYAGAPG
jgi:DNA-binding response OmpR family regulator